VFNVILIEQLFSCLEWPRWLFKFFQNVSSAEFEITLRSYWIKIKSRTSADW